jgi:CBS-domain-containing membrane protein
MKTQVIHVTADKSVMHLAKLMAAFQESCVIVVDKDDWHDDLPVLLPIGIVTERDIMQFHALGLDLVRTSAQVVMSTPLFLASPEDSLWTAHQEMLRRHFQRLVVSWNWGTRLALLTQTNLLRVFDPIEMYGVLETLHQDEPQRQHTLLFKTINGTPDPQASPASSSLSSLEELQSPVVTIHSLDILLSDLQTRLSDLAANPDLSSETRNIRLTTAIAELQNIRTLILQQQRNTS